METPWACNRRSAPSVRALLDNKQEEEERDGARG